MNVNIINFVLQFLAITVAYVAGRYSAKQEQQITSRIIFEKCYHPIFTTIESDFYSKELTLEQMQNHAKEILEIFKNSNGYYYHSLEEYCYRLSIVTDISTAKELWLSFCWSFDRQLIKIEKSLGLPRRSFAYRMNRNQFSSKTQMFISFILNYPSVLVLLVIYIALYILQKIYL